MDENTAGAPTEPRLCPFPGMDPYLEGPDIWPDVLDSLAGALRGALNALLPEPYYARLQMRPELGIVLEEGVPHRIIPDVVVVHPAPGEATGAAPAVAAASRTELSPGIKVRVRTDPFRHAFVEIRDAAHGHRLVTLIEIVSPSNKRPGPDRRAYLMKQKEVLESYVNLIEIDLLRGGQRLLPYPDLEEAVHQLQCDYLVLVNRGCERQGNWTDYILYPVDVREPLPCIPVPLEAGDPDVPLDLQAAFHRVYVEGPYRRAVDYGAALEPPLEDADAAWAAEIVGGVSASQRD